MMNAPIKASYDDKIHHLLKAVESGSVPEHLKSVHASLLKKTQNFIEQRDALFQEDEEYVTHPGMGILAIKREILDQPISLFGANLKVKNLVTLSLYRARVKKSDGSHQKGDLIARYRMSERQMGEIMIGLHSGSGFPVTCDYLDGAEVEPYSVEFDPTKYAFKSMFKQAVSSCDQVNGFIDEIQFQIDEGKEKNRLAAKDVKEIQKNLGSIASYSVNNSDYYMENFGTEIASRVNEALVDVDIQVSRLLQKDK